jgi:hypothetical protein
MITDRPFQITILPYHMPPSKFRISWPEKVTNEDLINRRKLNKRTWAPALPNTDGDG